MIKLEGNILKMRTVINNPVDYYLRIGADEIYMNELLGKTLSFAYQHKINCIHCGRKTRTSFAQGYCYPCFQSLPETDACIIRPELCQAHLGISRDQDWAEKNCLQDHIVYLALSSALKVGVTRQSQVPTRWIDQGAWKAIKLAKTPNRNLAGQIEVALKAHLTDKTNWRHMLTNKLKDGVDMLNEKQRIKELIPEQLQQYYIDEDEITELDFPVNEYPAKVKSLGFDKQAEFEGTLTGIKGQYLLFEGGFVINIRKHAGYLVEMAWE
ncbi:MAG: DUF2797 domain-containing protein [Bacteroidota bacterium]|nr:DUF2797 domain-containing protein [Bacteroidota bacterium]